MVVAPSKRLGGLSQGISEVQQATGGQALTGFGSVATKSIQAYLYRTFCRHCSNIMNLFGTLGVLCELTFGTKANLVEGTDFMGGFQICLSPCNLWEKKGDNEMLKPKFLYSWHHTIAGYGTVCTLTCFNPTNKALEILNYAIRKEQRRFFLDFKGIW